MTSRKTMFAGSWYPSGADRCKQQILEFLSEETFPFSGQAPFVGGIVPHAGWYFSGAIACRVIHLLSLGTPPDVMLVFGMHLRPGAGSRIMKEGDWQTPFGDLPIDAPLADALAQKFSFKVETASEFTPDNTIELQLPFIKYFFPDIRIVPVGIPPDREALEIGSTAVTTAMEMGLTVKVLGSTDLTHYGANYGFMPHGSGIRAVNWVREENDRRVIDAMLAMDPDLVLHEAASRSNACCAGAAAAAIAAARSLGAKQGHTVSYATSYDKSPGDSLVGYAGIVFQH